jgi:hydroxymethylglutaryl-CoA synthase
MEVLRIFRRTPDYQEIVLDKLVLGSETMRDLGNLYTAALPAWMAAGFEEAMDSGLDLTGEEILTLGYGSGDAAEVIPITMCETWREATARIGFSRCLEPALDLSQAQYEALHDGRRVQGLDYLPNDEFVIERVGDREDRQFQDLGIEYYRYVG